jgi:hypothetical protein
MKQAVLALIVLLLLTPSASVFAQDDIYPEEGYPTLASMKVSAGWGFGRSRQLYGMNGNSEVWWSTGEGVKMNVALDLPLIQINVVNPDSLDFGLSTTPLVGLELEVGSGYLLSTGGTTNDAISNNVFITTRRTASYIPLTVGFNVRSSFGAGMPSVYIGVGGGVYIPAIYDEEVFVSSTHESSERKMNPPVPFGLHGSLGFELPLTYYPEDGNSMFDLFGELRLTEMSSYVYDYVVDGKKVGVRDDPEQRFLPIEQRSASNVSLAIGLKINFY